MFWADALLEKLSGKQRINDSFTPSGPVHMGSLKGPILHDTLYRILKSQNKEVEFWYGFDDADPIDGLPKELQESHEKYLGVPLFLAPSPEKKGSFADYFINRMKKLLDQLDIHPKYYRTSELYKEGMFNNAIQFILDHRQEVRGVYSKVYKKEIAKDWYPLQVICPKCGKLGTTKVVKWDGKEISFLCEENLVKWAKGCGFSGKVSPFNGTSKMPWKVEWAAKWWTFGVTIEGAGKDHASAGGSYDIAMKLTSEVFRTKPPLKFAYEFFLSGGKKMSSSKGLGLWGNQLLEVLPPEIVHFLMIYLNPNIAVEFSPTETIPKIYDLYSLAGQDYFFDKKDKRLPIIRAYELSQLKSLKKPPAVRFTTLAQWAQMPNMEQKIKEEHLERWVKYARTWVDRFAPESDKFTVQKNVPDAVKELTDDQKRYLKNVVQQLEKKWEPEDFQKNLYNLAKKIGISSKDAFAAIYLSLLGKNHGPKAGWLILSLDNEFVKKRFNEI
ncbi:MAG: lysine--tRNA ligase [Candidatus Levybacteria bacterium]|nr:lysine--tRNA ligase [Candidatus Levybacteria bacterium]